MRIFSLIVLLALAYTIGGYVNDDSYLNNLHNNINGMIKDLHGNLGVVIPEVHNQMPVEPIHDDSEGTFVAEDHDDKNDNLEGTNHDDSEGTFSEEDLDDGNNNLEGTQNDVEGTEGTEGDERTEGTLADSVVDSIVDRVVDDLVDDIFEDIPDDVEHIVVNFEWQPELHVETTMQDIVRTLELEEADGFASLEMIIQDSENHQDEVKVVVNAGTEQGGKSAWVEVNYKSNDNEDDEDIDDAFVVHLDINDINQALIDAFNDDNLIIEAVWDSNEDEDEDLEDLVDEEEDVSPLIWGADYGVDDDSSDEVEEENSDEDQDYPEFQYDMVDHDVEDGEDLVVNVGYKFNDYDDLNGYNNEDMEYDSDEEEDDSDDYDHLYHAHSRRLLAEL